MSKKSRKKRTQAKAKVVQPVVAQAETAAAAAPQATMAEAATGRTPIESSYGHVRGELTRIGIIAAVLATTLVVLSLVL